MNSSEAASGVATVDAIFYGAAVNPQITVVPISASGTGTVTVKPEANGATYEAVLDSSGAALTVDLSVQASFNIEGKFLSVKVTSDNSADTFFLSVA